MQPDSFVDDLEWNGIFVSNPNLDIQRRKRCLMKYLSWLMSNLPRKWHPDDWRLQHNNEDDQQQEDEEGKSWRPLSFPSPSVCSLSLVFRIRMTTRTRMTKVTLSLHPQLHFLPPPPFVRLFTFPRLLPSLSENSPLPTVAASKVHIWTLVLDTIYDIYNIFH